jgi:hypothetical protein
MEKPKVGQKLYSLNVGNAARHTESKLTEVVVKKVGRKYFTCGVEDKTFFDIQYHLDNWREKTDYSPVSRLYKGPQDYEDEKEAQAICKFVGDYFKYGDNPARIPLSILKGFKKVIEIYQMDLK